MALAQHITALLLLIRGQIRQRDGIFRSVGALSAGEVTTAILGIAGGVLVARFIPPEVNGQFRIYTIPMMYLTFLHLGTFDGLYRQIPYYLGQQKHEYLATLVASAGAWNVFAVKVVGGGFVLCALVNFVGGNMPAAAGWLAQAIGSIGIYYLGFLGATYRASGNFLMLARIQVAQAVLVFASVAAVALWGFYGLCFRVAIPVLLIGFLYHYARPFKDPLCFNKKALVEVVKVGLPFCFWGTLDTSLWVATEYSLMLYFGGVTAVGYFSVALIMRESFCFLPQSLHQVIQPRTVAQFARGGVGDVVRRNIKIGVFCALLMLVALGLVSWLLELIVPIAIPKYTGGLPLMKVCLCAAIIQSLNIPLSGLMATGRSWLVGKGVLAGMLVFPLAVIVLVPLLGGMLAVAVGSLIGRLTRTCVAYFDLAILLRSEAP